jgi:hypothetical protein
LIYYGNGIVGPVNVMANSSWILKNFIVVAAFGRLVSEKVHLLQVNYRSALPTPVSKATELQQSCNCVRQTAPASRGADNVAGIEV